MNIDYKVYQVWKSLVNMTGSQLQKFYDSSEGKKAGLSRSQAAELNISSGRQSARWIIKMKAISYKKWNPQMWKWAKKQISFISRMTAIPGKLYDSQGNKTRKHLALLIWGHDPTK